MEITPQINQSIAAGISSGSIRFISSITGFVPRSEDIRDAQNLISDSLKQIDDKPWNPRAVLIFSELITIGMFSRKHFNESKLTIDEIINSVEIFKAFR